jgi:hypothetical protein
MTTSGNTDHSAATETVADFIDYSADLLRNLQRIAEGNHLTRYAHLISLATVEAQFLKEQLKGGATAAVISIDEKRPRHRP